MSRRGWFDGVRDFFKLREAKSQILDALRRTPRPGGVDLPRNDPVFAIAATQIVAENPSLTVTKFKNNLMLCRRDDLAATTSVELHTHLRTHGYIAEPGEKLYDDF